jgi:hypothetical protein
MFFPGQLINSSGCGKKRTYPIAAVAKSGMTDIASNATEILSIERKLGVIGGRLELVGRMVAMLALLEAWNAEIVVRAGGASDEAILGEYFDATVAGTRRRRNVVLCLLFLGGKGARHLLLGSEHGPGGNSFSGAVDDLAVLQIALDEPMGVVLAVTTIVAAGGADIIVSIIADIAMIVLVQHDLVANVAVDGPRAGGARRKARRTGKTWNPHESRIVAGNMPAADRRRDGQLRGLDFCRIHEVDQRRWRADEGLGLLSGTVNGKLGWNLRHLWL